jgi:hypothetical protein
VIALVGEDAVAIDKHLELSIGVPHLRPDAVFGFEFALQAPGQTS